MLTTLSSSVLAFLVSTTVQIPKEPDFSGHWGLVQGSGAPAEAASVLTVHQTITRTTRRGEPMTPWFSDITVQRHFSIGVVSETYKIGIISGTVGGVPAGRRYRTANGRPSR